MTTRMELHGIVVRAHLAALLANVAGQVVFLGVPLVPEVVLLQGSAALLFNPANGANEGVRVGPRGLFRRTFENGTYLIG